MYSHPGFCSPISEGEREKKKKKKTQLLALLEFPSKGFGFVVIFFPSIFHSDQTIFDERTEIELVRVGLTHETNEERFLYLSFIFHLV